MWSQKDQNYIAVSSGKGGKASDIGGRWNKWPSIIFCLLESSEVNMANTVTAHKEEGKQRKETENDCG